MKALGAVAKDKGYELIAFEAKEPTPGPFDLLVQVKAVSLNPVDVKAALQVTRDQADPRILGWDAAGVVTKVGANVTDYKPGDEVYYAGDISKSGSNAELHAVDSRIVALKPHSLSFAQAAAIPLTALTAWELLFDRMGLRDEEKLLLVNGAGGVGSMSLQLLRAKLPHLKVTATASRPESRSWVEKLGASEVVHPEELQQSKFQNAFPAIACLYDTDPYFDLLTEVVAPEGKIGFIVGAEKNHDIQKLMRKSASLHWELMFTRSLFQKNMLLQREILQQVARLLDDRILQPTATTALRGLSVETFSQAHAMLASQKTIGKVTVEF